MTHIPKPQGLDVFVKGLAEVGNNKINWKRVPIVEIGKVSKNKCLRAIKIVMMIVSAKR